MAKSAATVVFEKIKQNKIAAANQASIPVAPFKPKTLTDVLNEPKVPPQDNSAQKVVRMIPVGNLNTSSMISNKSNTPDNINSGMEVDTTPVSKTHVENSEKKTEAPKPAPKKESKKRTLDESKTTDDKKKETAMQIKENDSKPSDDKPSKKKKSPPKKKQKTDNGKKAKSSEPKAPSKSQKKPAKKDTAKNKESEDATKQKIEPDNENEKGTPPKKKKNCSSFKRVIMNLKKDYHDGIQLPVEVTELLNNIVYFTEMRIQNAAKNITLKDGRVTITQPDICGAIKLCLPQAISQRYRPVKYLPKFYQPRNKKKVKASAKA